MATCRINRVPRIAYISIDGQAKGLPCTIRELRSDGACLTLTGWIGVPETFSLYFDRHGARFRCRVLARRGSIVSVAFDS